MTYLKKGLLSIILILVTFLGNSQVKKKPLIKNYICTTYVYNLTTGIMRIRDICFNLTNTDHIDMNQYSPGKDWDKTKDFWKFSIDITDNDKKSKQNFNGSFYVYEESSEIKQYHCLVEDVDFKAIIFDKINKSWQILLYQNDEYKILSSYTGYHYINAFGIKQKKNSSTDY